MSILENLFSGTLRKAKHGRSSAGGLADLQALPVRPYRELAAVCALYSSPFAAAIEGELSAEEYLKLECGVGDDIES